MKLLETSSSVGKHKEMFIQLMNEYQELIEDKEWAHEQANLEHQYWTVRAHEQEIAEMEHANEICIFEENHDEWTVTR